MSASIMIELKCSKMRARKFCRPLDLDSKSTYPIRSPPCDTSRRLSNYQSVCPQNPKSSNTISLTSLEVSQGVRQAWDHGLLHIPMLRDAGTIQPENINNGLVSSVELDPVNVKSNVVEIRNDAGDVVDETRSGKDLGHPRLGDCFARWREGIVLDVGVNNIRDEGVQILVSVCLSPDGRRFALKTEQSLRRLRDKLWKLGKNFAGEITAGRLAYKGHDCGNGERRESHDE